MKTFTLKFIVFVSLFLSVPSLQAQGVSIGMEKPEHRIIFQFSNGDTLAHKQLMKQLTNIVTLSPTSKVEVVCQGGGLDMLTQGKTIVAEKIKSLTEKGVQFMACEFAMKERKIEHSQIISQAGFVPAGILEIVSKQEQGWSYIRSAN